MTDNDKCAREQYIIQLEAEVRKLRDENSVLKERNNLTEICEVEAALQLSEEKFSKAFHDNQTAMAISRMNDGVFIDVNNKYAASLGYRRQDIVGKTVLELNIWGELEDRQKMQERLSKYNYIKDGVFKFKRKTGEIGFGLATLNVLDIDGEQHLLTSFIDITEHNKTEEALKASEEKFSKSFHESGSMKAIARCSDGILIDVNESYAATFGYMREEMIGKTVLELGIWGDMSERQGMWEQLCKVGFVKDWEYKIRTKSGEINYVVSNVNLINVDGEECILSSSNNITALKKAEEDLIRTHKLLYQVFDSIPQSLIIQSKRDGTLIEVNKEFLDENRVTLLEVIGQKQMFEHSVGNPEEICRCYENLDKDGFIRNLEVSLDSIPRGESRTVLLNAVPIDWMGEECSLIVSNDITELRRFQSEISKLDSIKLIGQMAGSIAHEVRNPMTAIKGFLQLFHEQYKYREDREAIELMIEELDRVNGIISDFLSLSKINHIQLKATKLSDCISNTLQLILADALKNDVFVNTKFEDKSKIMIDKGEIGQLLLNLARNAIEAMPSGGTLTVHTFEDTSGVNLVVQDEGGGIPPDMLEKIWTPFLTTKKNGTGLGMPVCRSIAERHNATITVDTSPEGTSFKVTFPVGE